MNYDDFEIYEERQCDCGKCRYCRAHSVSDYDSDAPCWRCGGAGCTICEESE